MNIGRRNFLQLAGASLLARPVLSAAQNERKKIIVAGAGLAGLSAAYELAKLGFAVTVIEARNRVGGRVFTLREPFADDLHVETGGELIGDGYRRFLNYAREFGIEFEELKTGGETGGGVAQIQKGIAQTAVMKGKIYPIGSTLEPHPYNLTGEEAALLPPALLAKHRRDIFSAAMRKRNGFAEYKNISLAAALRKRGASRTAIRLMDISLNYNSIETVGADAFLWELNRSRNVGTKAIRLPAGNDQIPNALKREAEKLGVKFVFNAQIKQISHSNGQVRVSFQNSKRAPETLEADRLVCTIPFSVLREIEFAPALPDAKMRAIRELAYTQITKTYIQAKRENWDKNDFGTSVWTDTEAERIFANGTQNTARRIFTIWTEGAGAAKVDRMTDAARIAWGKRIFAETLPPMKTAIESPAATKSWGRDEFARGAYAHFAVGQLTEFQTLLPTSVGELHFAGEQTAENAPGMEGALESAERIVTEIRSQN